MDGNSLHSIVNMKPQFTYKCAIYGEYSSLNFWDQVIGVFVTSFFYLILRYHIFHLVYSYQCPMLHQVKGSPVVAKNVLDAFKEIHARGIYHGDVRSENILVRPDDSVVVIDFEASEMNADPDLLDVEMKEVKALVSRFNQF